MNNKIAILILLLSFSTIYAQTISLESAAQCLNNPNCADYTYAKDLNNSLQQYIGVWKGNHNGKSYEIKLNKILYEDMGQKTDILAGRLQLKDNNGNTLYTSYNETDDTKTNFTGLNFQADLKAYRMYFVGNSQCGEYGTVYLRIKQETPNQMSLFMLADQDIIKEGLCPSNFSPIIPYKTTIFLTRQ